MERKWYKSFRLILGAFGGLCVAVWFFATGRAGAAFKLLTSLGNRNSGRDVERDKERDRKFRDAQQRVADGADRVEEAGRTITSSGSSALEHIGRAEDLAGRSNASIQRLKDLVRQAEQKSGVFGENKPR